MMFIGKFNKLIRNRVFWGAFAFLICVSFALLYIQDSGPAYQPQEPVQTAELNGEPVPYEEYNSAYINTVLQIQLELDRSGYPPAVVSQLKQTYMTPKRLREFAWQRVISLREAAALGITVEKDEIIRAIKEDVLFQENGRYDERRYASFTQGYMRDYANAPMVYENFVREELLRAKLRGALVAGLWISPAEVQHAMHDTHDYFTTEYTIITTNYFTTDVTVTLGEAEEHFEDNKEAFTIPERVSVNYVAFPFDDFTNDIEVVDDEIEQFYNSRTNFYAVFTNETLLVPPLDEIRDEVVADFRRQEAVTRAEGQASDFMNELLPGQFGKATSFDTAATKFDRPILATELFTATDEVAGQSAGYRFNATGLALDATPDDYFSDPLTGTNACYVLALVDRVEPTVPEFDEVTDKATAAALAIKKQTAWEETLQGAADSIRDALAAEETFTEAVTKLSLPVFTNEPFAAHMREEVEHGEALLQGLMIVNEGEITEPIPTYAGVLLAYLAKRETVNIPDQALTQSLIQELVNRRTNRYVDEWLKHRLAEANFVDLNPVEEDPDDEETL